MRAEIAWSWLDQACWCKDKGVPVEGVHRGQEDDRRKILRLQIAKKGAKLNIKYPIQLYRTPKTPPAPSFLPRKPSIIPARAVKTHVAGGPVVDRHVVGNVPNVHVHVESAGVRDGRGWDAVDPLKPQSGGHTVIF